MKINGNAVRPGMVIEHKGQLWRAVKSQQTQPGKGGAYNQVELKSLLGNTKLNERFRASENVERVRLDEKRYQFLYADDDLLTFMDTADYEQITLPAAIVGAGRAYLQDGMEVTIHSYEGQVISTALPDTVILAVTETEPVVKGQTAASSFKPALLENGTRTTVPPHIEVGTRVVVSTADGSYSARAKD